MTRHPPRRPGQPSLPPCAPAGDAHSCWRRRDWLGSALVLAGAGWLPPRPATATPAAGGAAAAPPVYPTRLPGAAVLEYGLSYGMVSGFGRLTWEPPLAGRYRLHLVGRALGLQLLEWVSEGGVDAAGLAPWRFVERRIGREERVAEFRREAGRIHYPARPGRDAPLLAGAQDRLSWLVQLGAILRASPALQAAGQRIELYVSGVRGDAERWIFEVQAVEDGLLHLRRRAEAGAEVRGEAWLSPAPALLPVRVRLVSGSSDVLEMRLRPS